MQSEKIESNWKNPEARPVVSGSVAGSVPGSGSADRAAVFSQKDVAADINWRWLDSGVCRKWVLSRLFPAGPRCPDCGAAVRPGRATDSWWQLRRVHCLECGSRYRSTKGSFLQGSTLDFRQVVILAWAFSCGLTNSAAAKVAEVDNKTARFWRLRLAVGDFGMTSNGAN